MKLYMKRENFTSQRNKYLVHRLAQGLLSWGTNGKNSKVFGEDAVGDSIMTTMCLLFLSTR